MQVKTKCCTSEVVEHHSTEYPLGDRFGISCKVDVCEHCGDERPEVVGCCDMCGEPSEKLIETKLGGLCEPCLDETIVQMVENARKLGLRAVIV